MKKRYAGFSAFYTFSYMALGVLMPLIGQYLDYIGFSGTQIGSITATGTCVAIFASTIWGKVYNASSNKYVLILLLCAAAALTGIVLMHAQLYLAVLFLYGCMYFFQSPVMAFSDALTLEEQLPFSGIRKWGAVGFALGVFVAGRLADLLDLSVIFYLYSAGFLISAALLFFLSWKKSTGKKPVIGRRKGTYRGLLREPKLIQLIICIFFVGGTNVANNTYFSFLYIQGGGTIAGLGVVMLFMVGSEAPFMQWSAALASKFTLEKTILGAVIFSAVRFFIYSLSPSWVVLAGLFFTQGAVNGIILVEFVRYVTKLAPKGHEDLAVAAYYAIGSNGSAIVCQLAGGAALDALGPDGVYSFFAIFNMIGALLYVFFGLHREAKGSSIK